MTFLGVLVMLVLPVLLVWVPVPGLAGFIAGVLGGYLIGRPGRAMLYALLPFALFAALFVAAGMGLGIVGGPGLLLAGGAVGTALGGLAFLLLLASHIGLRLGAGVGGALRLSRPDRRRLRGRATDGVAEFPAVV